MNVDFGQVGNGFYRILLDFWNQHQIIQMRIHINENTRKHNVFQFGRST